MQLPVPQVDRRASEREAPPIPTTVQLTLHESDGNRMIVAQILSLSYSGIGVNCNQALCPGTKLTYTHPLRARLHTARVAWCKANETHGFEHGISNESFDSTNRVDHYTVLQVNSTAEPCMIDGAYQFLSERYSPRNLATANPQIYERLAAAHAVLSDPVKRTAYEAERATTRNGSSTVVKGERNAEAIRNTRQEMLDMLYWRRVESPYKPVITIHEFETILKLPKEQMEFNLWFLRDKGLIARSDNACFVITAEGVVWAEDFALKNSPKMAETSNQEEDLEAVRRGQQTLALAIAGSDGEEEPGY